MSYGFFFNQSKEKKQTPKALLADMKSLCHSSLQQAKEHLAKYLKQYTKEKVKNVDAVIIYDEIANHPNYNAEKDAIVLSQGDNSDIRIYSPYLVEDEIEGQAVSGTKFQYNGKIYDYSNLQEEQQKLYVNQFFDEAQELFKPTIVNHRDTVERVATYIWPPKEDNFEQKIIESLKVIASIVNVLNIISGGDNDSEKIEKISQLTSDTNSDLSKANDGSFLTRLWISFWEAISRLLGQHNLQEVLDEKINAHRGPGNKMG